MGKKRKAEKAVSENKEDVVNKPASEQQTAEITSHQKIPCVVNGRQRHML